MTGLTVNRILWDLGLAVTTDYQYGFSVGQQRRRRCSVVYTLQQVICLFVRMCTARAGYGQCRTTTLALLSGAPAFWCWAAHHCRKVVPPGNPTTSIDCVGVSLCAEPCCAVHPMSPHLQEPPKAGSVPREWMYYNSYWAQVRVGCGVVFSTQAGVVWSILHQRVEMSSAEALCAAPL